MSPSDVEYQQGPGELARTTADLHLTQAERDIVAALRKGNAPWRIGTAGRRVHTDLGETEASPYDTDAAINTPATVDWTSPSCGTPMRCHRHADKERTVA